eukprot:m.161326 g.161326  ORF g.161326 m.161326 type:complete len:1598 (+) comp16526_c0_seq1:148-4941(+)
MGKKKSHRKKFVAFDKAIPGERQRSISEGGSRKHVEFNLAENEVHLFTPPRRRRKQEIVSAPLRFDGTGFDIDDYVYQHRLTLKSSRSQRHKPLSDEEASELELQGILSDTSASDHDDSYGDGTASVPVSASGKELFHHAPADSTDETGQSHSETGDNAGIPGLPEDPLLGLSKSARKRRKRKERQAAAAQARAMRLEAAVADAQAEKSKPADTTSPESVPKTGDGSSNDAIAASVEKGVPEPQEASKLPTDVEPGNDVDNSHDDGTPVPPVDDAETVGGEESGDDVEESKAQHPAPNTNKKTKKKKKKKQCSNAPARNASLAVEDVLIQPIAVQGLRVPEHPSLEFPLEPRFDIYTTKERVTISVYIPHVPPEQLDVLLRPYGMYFRVSQWQWGLKFPFHVLPSGTVVRVSSRKVEVKLLKASAKDVWQETALVVLSDKGRSSFLTGLQKVKGEPKPLEDAATAPAAHLSTDQAPSLSDSRSIIDNIASEPGGPVCKEHTPTPTQEEVPATTASSTDTFDIPNQMLEKAGLLEEPTAPQDAGLCSSHEGHVLEELTELVLDDATTPVEADQSAIDAIAASLKDVTLNEERTQAPSSADAAGTRTDALGKDPPATLAKSPSSSDPVVGPQLVVAGGKTTGLTVDFLSHNWDDSGDTLHVSILGAFLKHKVYFNEQSFLVRFKTNDTRLWPDDVSDVTEKTVLEYGMLLHGLIDPLKSSAQASSTGIAITLVKAPSVPWSALEWSSGSSAPSSPMKVVPSSAVAVSDVAQSAAASPAPASDQVTAPIADVTSVDEHSQNDLIKPPSPSPKPDSSIVEVSCVSAEATSMASLSKCESEGTVPDGNSTSEATAMEQEVENAATTVPIPLVELSVILPIKGGQHGLRNLGNTCFMNSVLQCLAQTPALAAFFLDYDRVEKSLNTHPKSLGSKGRIARAFHELVVELWDDNDYMPVGPRAFKAAISRRSERFKGYGQQDAQEFLEFLLDELHEDVNRVGQKPYVELKSSDGRPDQEVAAEAWRDFLKRDDSPIVDLFQGQLKSKLTCPTCSHVSITFDPFRTLSLPLPSLKQTVAVVLLPAANGERIRYSLEMEKRIDQDVLLNKIEKLSGIPASHLVPATVDLHTLTIGLPPSLRADAQVWVFELPSLALPPSGKTIASVHQYHRPVPQLDKCRNCHRKVGSVVEVSEDTADAAAAPATQVKLMRCTRCRQVGYCSQACQKEHWKSHRVACQRLQSNDKVVGIPFAFEVEESISYKGLEAVVRNRAYQLAATQIQPIKRQMEVHKEAGLTDDGVDWTLDPKELALAAESNPFVSAKLQFMLAVKQNIALKKKLDRLTVSLAVSNFKGERITLNTKEKDVKIQLPDLIKVDLTWGASKRSDLDQLATTARADVTDHDPDAAKSRKPAGALPSLTLRDAVKAFSRPERLGSNDQWYCPKCKEHQEAMKELSLWRLPDHLIVHLKRFSWRNIVFRDKLNHYVDYPQTLSPADLLPADHPDQAAAATAEPYELYGVVRHFGRLSGGHYVATAKHATSHEWFEYNDTFVKPAQEQDAVHESGYLLMYRKPSAVTAQASFSSSAQGSDDQEKSSNEVHTEVDLHAVD